MAGERERLPRLLALVPFLQANPGIKLVDAAADLAITTEQLRRDLQLLWMCGLPGHGPGDLIDLSFEGETISVIFDAGISRPQRLNSQEALALIVALRTLAETPGVSDRDAVERALAKIETAAGGPVEAVETISVQLDDLGQRLAILQGALEAGRALSLRYYTVTRDETTERTVDPMRIFEIDGHSYLEAWCRRADGMRVFRVDRIESVHQLTEAAAPPAQARLRDLSAGLYTPAENHVLVELRVEQSFSWVGDYYPTATSEPTDGGGRVISLHVADETWVRALVLGSGGAVTVLSPQSLADAIHAEAHAALAQYR